MFLMHEIRRSKDLLVSHYHFFFGQQAQYTNLFIVRHRHFTPTIHRLKYLGEVDYIFTGHRIGCDILSQKINHNTIR